MHECKRLEKTGDLLMVPLPLTISITSIGRCSVAYVIFASVCSVLNVFFFSLLFQVDHTTEQGDIFKGNAPFYEMNSLVESIVLMLCSKVVFKHPRKLLFPVYR